MHAQKNVLIRLQCSNYSFHGDFPRHHGSILGDIIRVGVINGAGVARGLGAGLDGMTTSRSVCSATGCSGPTGEGSSECCAACGIWSVMGDVGGDVWNPEVSGSAAICTDSVGLSVGAISGSVDAVSGEAGSVGIGNADSVGSKGGRNRLGRLLNFLYARAGKGTAREWQETAGTAFHDYLMGDGKQAY